MKPPAAFEVLGLTREAAPEEIRRAYRRLALRYHPDRNPDDPNAEKKFKELVVSYEKIKNLPARPSPSTASAEKDMDRPIDPDLEEIISEIFRNARNKTERRPVRGSDLTASLELTFEEAALGAERELRLRRRVSCDVCRGGGGYPHGRSERCPHCGGGGELSFRRGSAALSIPCSSCRGEGVRFLDPCPACSGEGRRQREKIVPAVLPPATADGAQIKQRGKGDEGLDFGEPGDLYIGELYTKVPKGECLRFFHVLDDNCFRKGFHGLPESRLYPQISLQLSLARLVGGFGNLDGGVFGFFVHRIVPSISS